MRTIHELVKVILQCLMVYTKSLTVTIYHGIVEQRMQSIMAIHNVVTIIEMTANHIVCGERL